MSRAQMIRQYVTTHPGKTCKEIAEALGIPIGTVSGTTTVEFKEGRMSRVLVGRTLSNAPVYGYAITDTETVVSTPETVVSKPKRSAKPAVLDTLLDQFASNIAMSLVERVKDRLIEELQSIVPQVETQSRPLLEEIQARIAVAVPAVADKRKKVVIVGLLPSQAGHITNEFHDAFDLRFVESGDKPGRVKDAAKDADGVFLFSSKLGHHVEESLKSMGKPFTRIMGGMTQLRDALTAMYVGG